MDKAVMSSCYQAIATVLGEGNPFIFRAIGNGEKVVFLCRSQKIPSEVVERIFNHKPSFNTSLCEENGHVIISSVHPEAPKIIRDMIINIK